MSRSGVMMRFGLIGAAVALSTPAMARSEEVAADTAFGSYRELTSVAPRRSNCAAGKSRDEIMVCGRRRDNLRYRLPPSESVPGTRAAQSVGGERFALQQYRVEGGSGSCSTVGPNGSFGCLTHRFREADEESAGRTPGLIARALTYLDADE
jgi:hypothetical protein